MEKLAGREVKAGLAVIGGLLIVLGLVLYKRLGPAAQTPDSAVATAAEVNTPAEGAPPQQPTILLSQTPEDEVGGPADRLGNPEESTASSDGDRPGRDLAPGPQNSFMPSEQAVDKRHPARNEETAAEPDRGRPRAQGSRRNPFAERTPEPAAASEPLTPTDDPELSSNPAAEEARDEQARVIEPPSRPIRPAREVLAAAEAQQAAAVEQEGEQPRARDLYPSRYPETQEPRTIEDARDPRRPQAQEAPPREGREFTPPRGAAATPLPTAAENGTYTVQPNDNYWVISEKVYGVGGYFKAIHQHNKGKFPHADKLQVGDKLSVPPLEELEQNYGDLVPKRRHVQAVKNMTIKASARQRIGGKIYVVQEGDTLFDIARYQLGKASRWAEIYDLNRESLGEDFDFLQPGSELTLPGSSSRSDEDTLTRRQGTTR